jgi:gliding motility-associated-like protein
LCGYLSHAFTPNGDGVNQLFYGTGSGVVKYELSVYNRNNQLIFNCADLFCGWDGSYKGQQVMNGVYTYIIDVTYNTGEQFRKSGTVTLIR